MECETTRPNPLGDRYLGYDVTILMGFLIDYVHGARFHPRPLSEIAAERDGGRSLGAQGETEKLNHRCEFIAVGR